MSATVYIVEARMRLEYGTCQWQPLGVFSDELEAEQFSHRTAAAQGTMTKLTPCEASGSLHFLLAHAAGPPPLQPEVVTCLRRESVAGVVREVVRDLSRLTGFTHADIRGSRYLSVMRVRKLGYWVTAHRCNRAWSDLGRAWGKDHSTVMDGCRSFQADLGRRVPWAVELAEAWNLAAGAHEAVAS